MLIGLKGMTNPIMKHSTQGSTAGGVGLIATCLNEAGSVRQWKESIVSQTRKPEQIAIVDAGSTDGTTEILRAWQDSDATVRVFSEPRCNAARARNIAIENLNSDIIASCDFGNRYDKHWLEELVRPFEEDESVMVVAGNFLGDDAVKDCAAARAAFLSNNDYRPRFVTDFLPSNRSVAYRRSAWAAAGRHPEDLTFYGDDVVFGLLLHGCGLKMVTASKAVAIWSRHRRLRDYWKEAFKYGCGSGEAGVVVRHAKPALRLPPFGAYALAVPYALMSVPAAARAALRGDLLAAGLVLPLRYGYYINEIKGYRVGLPRGRSQCAQTRLRLQAVGFPVWERQGRTAPAANRLPLGLPK